MKQNNKDLIIDKLRLDKAFDQEIANGLLFIFFQSEQNNCAQLNFGKPLQMQESAFANALLNHRLLIVFTSVFQWRHSCNFSKYFTKRFHIRITHFIHYFINCFTTGFKCFFCRFNFYSLRIFNRSIPGCFDKPSVKVSPADSKPRRQMLQQIFFHPVYFQYMPVLFSPFHPRAISDL